MLGCDVFVRFAERDRLVEDDGVPARLKPGDPDTAGALPGGCFDQGFDCRFQAIVDLVRAGEGQVDGPGIRRA